MILRAMQWLTILMFLTPLMFFYRRAKQYWLRPLLGPAVRGLRFRPDGAKCDSMGQRPRKDHTAQTPKPQRGETNGIAPRCFAPLGLF